VSIRLCRRRRVLLSHNRALPCPVLGASRLGLATIDTSHDLVVDAKAIIELFNPMTRRRGPYMTESLSWRAA
jgi:hypothetical protein